MLLLEIIDPCIKWLSDALYDIIFLINVFATAFSLLRSFTHYFLEIHLGKTSVLALLLTRSHQTLCFTRVGRCLLMY